MMVAHNIFSRAFHGWQENLSWKLPANLRYCSAMGLLRGTSMRPIGFLILVTALSASAWSTCQAAGSHQNKPMFPDAQVVRSGTSEPIGKPAAPAASDLIGCGRGRVRDPETHGCRGPADIR
jgi:hypothetical protein